MRYTAVTHIPSIAIKQGVVPEGAQITIAIPTYKRAHLLRETLESCLAQQTNCPFAIMVVDNNPERECETEQLLREYKAIPNLFYYKNTENVGMTGNWNKLFELSQTNFVVMLHDDDLINPSYIEKIYDVLKLYKYNVNAIYVQHFLFTHISEISIQESNKNYRVIPLKPFDYIFGVFSTISGVCFNKKVAVKLNGFDDTHYPLMDYMFSYSITKETKVLKIVGVPLLMYRCDENVSSTAENTFKLIDEYKKTTDIILLDYPLYKKLYPSFFKYLIKKNVIEEQKRVFNTQDPRLDEKYNEITKSITPYDKIVYLFWRILRKVIFFSKRLYQKRI
ncbi:glycosyltransferase family 2 protein [Capnocytophaga genosp. AHN8471]|jgi:glycosyltransferase, group 2 family|uniref:glycosyltransferase family 2 protein n=1 Tax=Capnocytophaga genosp. AHN8471 TaxID=327574 RepID=UPI001932391E|nr:glycosyltransferase family 2 protein [Capnocytophaga genosp. AHN8471]MBM0653094.1 glycosyltransferase family 2 protein [Capnocytophaga genosp. AHN8471]MBM0656188.1 glycosyltransferase family 2 protein [Capnocytophaga genosp. AHN8471]